MYGSEGFTIYDLALWVEGLGISVSIFLVSSILGLILGCIVGLIRYYKILIIGKVLMMISEFLKNSPVLVQLFLVYFGIPALLAINMTPVEAAMITLTGNTAAFIAVIVISSIEAIDLRQLEAARSFALSERLILVKIIFPQALAISMPLLVGLAINQLQVTSLVSVIGVVDLTRVGDIINQRTFEPFIVWPIIGITYFILAKTIERIGARLERRFSAHRISNEI
ncbi:MAG: amino acid ABC transporter permease [Kordiimonadaceae bacterium]|jgi:His/Glu/Gln/Arg/opine family amino acid ABC transporter permease subunit|nr:amino acid ABC transporter permease [Kordiimonadaceae bacterium]